MLRELFKRIQGKGLNTPFKVGEGRYRVPARISTSADGELRYTISMKSVMLVIIAEQLGTDEPRILLQEYARRRFIEYVRQVTAEQEIMRLIDAAEASPSLQQSGGAKIIPFPQDGIRRRKLIVKRKPAICGPSNTVLEGKVAVADRTQETARQLGTTEAQVATTAETEDMTKKLVDAAIEEALKSARNDEERELLRKYLNAHPELTEDILDDCTRLALGVNESGEVQVARKQYRWRRVNEA